jgi:hypothetical protein
MALYYRGLQKRPKPIGTAEWESFKKFAVAHYKDAIAIANESLHGLGVERGMHTFLAILDKTASPLIYIWEEWQLLSNEQKLPYATPEYREFLEKAIAEAKKVAEKMTSQLGK